MIPSQSVKLYEKIKKIMLSFIKHAEIKKHSELLVEYTKSKDLMEKIDSIVTKNEYKCDKVLELIQDFINKTMKEKVPDNLLNYFYQYTLNKSFPQSISIELIKDFDIYCEMYISILRAVLECEKIIKGKLWKRKNTIEFLSVEEEQSLENPKEYKKFRKAFEEEYIYEMMKLDEAVSGHSTISHICGVHYVAMNIGRQLKKLGVEVDLGRVSGSAAGHDIGKYGCKGAEMSRVPYFHYYYTDYWFKKHDITYIGHIAVNHSTWDLELENLPLESLILIYSDFRVKSSRDANNKKIMKIFGLSEAFDVIFNKLDNMTEEKRRRYQRVYAKIKDFEDYIIHIGVDVEVQKKFTKRIRTSKSYYSLMQGQEIVQSFKHLAIKHNIELMHKLRHENALNAILESARNEKDWKNLREYIRLFDEYSTYLTQNQKLIMIKFLYEQLTHPEDDIRRHCAELIGSLIAMFDEEYRKEVPSDVNLLKAEITSNKLLSKYFNDFIVPDSRIAPTHREWIGYSASTMIYKLFLSSSESNINELVSILLGFYTAYNLNYEDEELYLLHSAKYIPIRNNYKAFAVLTNYAVKLLCSKDSILRLGAMDLLQAIIVQVMDDNELKTKIKEMLKPVKINGMAIAEKYMFNNLWNSLGEVGEFKVGEEEITNIYLNNLKSDTHWLVKKLQIQILHQNIVDDSKRDSFHTALHFCNLLKVSSTESVRNTAGEALVKIMPILPTDQRNDIAVELVRALEMDNYQYTSFIPYYLGQIMLCLDYTELNEFMNDMIEKIKHSSLQLNTLLLKTIGVFISHYISSVEGDRLIDKNLYICKKALQLILNSMADYSINIKQAAFAVIGKELFGSHILNMNQKYLIYEMTAKKILCLLADIKEYELQFLSNSATFNQIYRFISEYIFQNNSIELKQSQKVAFFNGTFDPFTLSHKQIAKTIRDMGFEVYISVDEYSWKRQALPNIIRRNIINMSVADELGIYIYPEDFPINLSNSYDIKLLKRSLQTAEIYIIAGTDEIIDNDCYSTSNIIQKNSVKNFPHIIFRRKVIEENKEDLIKANKAIESIQAKVIELELEDKYEYMSSSLIRDYIDKKRDISSFVDPLAQKYISEYGVYQREPQFKSLVKSISIGLEIIKNISEELMQQLISEFNLNSEATKTRMNEIFKKPHARILLLRNVKNKNKIVGFSIFHWIRSSMVYNEFKDSNITNYIYDNATGSMVMINGIFTKENTQFTKLNQMVLTETLAYCIARDFEYTVYNNTLDIKQDLELQQQLESYGFVKLPQGGTVNPIYAVSMSNPSTLYMDIRTIIKEPYRSSKNIERVIRRSRQRLMSAIAKLYPGNLVLPFDRAMLYETLTKKICSENGVSTDVSDNHTGKSICVPYGNILHKNKLPNTVTKSLHTEKYFNPDMRGYEIGAFPYYLDMNTQLKMIRSFNMPVILVDDMLNKGYRLKALDPYLKRNKLNIQKIIVGILTNRGRELADNVGRELSCAYYVPKLRAWFNESSMYPFIGGDAIWRGYYPHRNLLPSVNLILPYTYPSFLKKASKMDVYNLSKVSLENAVDLLTALQQEYQLNNERTLTLSSLGDVLTIPRCPDRGRDIEYNLNLSPSRYIINDIEQLIRIQQYEMR